MLIHVSGSMVWLQLVGKGVLSGAIVVGASELAKKTTLLGALVVSIPITSIMTMIWLYRDTGDVEKIASFSESVLWLVLPSLVLFIVLPILLRQGWGFTSALSVGIVGTVLAYGIGLWAASSFSTAA